MNREEVTDLIVTQKIKKKLTWAKLAEIVGHSKEWSTAALLGHGPQGRERRPDLPIIALTARVDPSDEATALAAGADVFLRKPVNLGELTEAILVITDQAGDDDG